MSPGALKCEPPFNLKDLGWCSRAPAKSLLRPFRGLLAVLELECYGAPEPLRLTRGHIATRKGRANAKRGRSEAKTYRYSDARCAAPTRKAFGTIAQARRARRSRRASTARSPSR